MSLLTILADNIHIVVVLIVIFLVTSFLLKPNKNLPPGPMGWPIVGNLFQIDAHLNFYALKLRERFHSDTVSVRLGGDLVVIMNSFETIKKMFAGDELLERPNIYFKRVITKGNGVLVSGGELWKQQRRFGLSAMRDFGMGKMAMDESIRDELEYVVSDISAQRGKAYDVERIICVSVANVMCKIAFGRRFEYDDKEFIDLQDRLEENGRLSSPSSAVNYFPLLEKIFPVPGAQRLVANNQHIEKYQQKIIADHKKTFDGVNIRDFIDAYLAEIAKTKDKPDSTFTDAQLNWIIYDLFLAGTGTTATALRFAILYMLHHPDVQAKVQEEIDEHIGQERAPTVRDRVNLNYTEAVISEVMRKSSFVPLAVPHANCERDIIIDGYTIPKATTVYANTYAVHHDPTLWKNPEKFDPSNFLDENGKHIKHPHLIPFSIGRRICLGEGLARMELFLFFSILLQRFTFKNPKGHPLPSLEQKPGIVNKPAVKFMVCAVER